MKFSTKLILSFICITLLLLAIGVISQYLNNEIKSRVVQESRNAVSELQLSGTMGTNLYQSLISTQYFLEEQYQQQFNKNYPDSVLNAGNPEERVEQALNNFDNRLAEFENLLETQQTQSNDGKSTGGNRVLIERLESRVDIYSSLIDQLLELTRDDYEDGREFFTVTIEPYFRSNILPLIDQLREQTQFNLDAEIDQLNDELTASSRKLAIATVAAFLLSILLAYLLYRSIARPLQNLSIAAKHIGAGNLDERIDVNSRDEVGQLGEEFNKMAENLGKTTVSKDFMDDIIESMADALIVTDEENKIQRINSAAGEMLHYNDSELTGKPLSTVLLKEDADDLANKSSDYEFKNYETHFLTKEQETVPVAVSRAIIHGSGNEIKGAVCVAADITRRREAEQQINRSLKEKEILLAEIHHRVKNNLAVISSLLQMQMWETESDAAQMALRDSQLRVQSIALVHKKLYQSDNFSRIQFEQYIPDLVQAIQENYEASEGIGIETSLHQVVLNINQAIPCALLLNELIINSIKETTDKGRKETLGVELWNKDGQVNLKIAETGNGRLEDFDFTRNDSFEMKIINTLVGQLEGSLQLNPDGKSGILIQFKQREIISS